MTELARAPDEGASLDLAKSEVAAGEAWRVARKLWSAADYFETTAYDMGHGTFTRGIDTGLDKESITRRKEQLALIREARESRKAACEMMRFAKDVDSAVPNANGAEVEESDVLKRAREMRAKLAEESGA